MTPSAVQVPAQSVASGRPSFTAGLLPGLAILVVLSLAATGMASLPGLAHAGISALTLAIALGMVAAHSFYGRIESLAAPGVRFAKHTLLRAGIIFFGLRLTFADVGRVGKVGVMVDLLMVCITFALAWFVGTRLFKLDRRTAMLIGAGSAICGAAAVMATEPVVKGRSEDVSIAVATVVVFGTLAIFLYPVLYHLNLQYGLLPLSGQAVGVYFGSTIHEVAQVVAAAHSVSPGIENAAVITKMVRVMLIAPFLIALSIYFAWESPVEAGTGQKRKRIALSDITIPWFAVGFVAMAGINSLHLIAPAVVGRITQADTFVLTMAMAALGLTTHVSALRTAGLRPIVLAALLFGWLIAGGALVNLAIAALLR